METIKATEITTIEKKVDYQSKWGISSEWTRVKMVIINTREHKVDGLLSDIGNERLASWAEIEKIRKSSPNRLIEFINQHLEKVANMYPKNYFI